MHINFVSLHCSKILVFDGDVFLMVAKFLFDQLIWDLENDINNQIHVSECFGRSLQLHTCHLNLLTNLVAELRHPKGPPSGAPYLYRKLKETHELIFSRLLASVIARGRIRTMAATATMVESHKMAAILQIIG